MDLQQGPTMVIFVSEKKQSGMEQNFQHAYEEFNRERQRKYRVLYAPGMDGVVKNVDVY